MIRALVLLGVGAGMATADPRLDWIEAQEQAHQWVLKSILSDETLMGYLKDCPADVFPAAGRRASGSKSCADAPGWCLALCRTGQGNACFGVARAIQTEMEDEGEASFTYPMFMAGCADGNANSCTNAAAGAKNGSWIEGTRPENAASRACQFRTYETACQTGASWGCYMLGLEWGVEGVEGQTDPNQARAAWQRSCNLKPNSSACAASRRELDWIE